MIRHASQFGTLALKGITAPHDTVKHIAMIIAENESASVLGVGELITRIPMLSKLAEEFPDASIEVFLKPSHFAIGLMPHFPNVSYKAVLGNAIFKTCKAPYNMFSAADLDGRDWDLVIDSSSGNGHALMKHILDDDEAHRIKSFIPCTMIPSLWNRPLRDLPTSPTAYERLRAHELFYYCLMFYLKSEMHPHTLPRPHVLQVLPPLPAASHRSILIIDKSPNLSKMWFHEGTNAFDTVASLLQRAGWRVFVHRYLGPGESFDSFPQYLASRPIYWNAPFGAFPAFFRENRPTVVLGIDTGVMHFVAAMTTDHKLMELFVTDDQNPYIWCAPGATAFTSFASRSFTQLTPQSLVAQMVEEYQ